ncbi:hypothetical protein [Myxococcus qinghaiensis]|uniref:hypothetical protein n=1 Tax=Myxococcus qinghaiensis TaxID=2906758 RepID=UPI0020A71893|nr:hypothetical protein [Myxococcus qinghaiensis]MCP3165109.1 hypothetical protein [Myxococcus qinghaiensis]
MPSIHFICHENEHLHRVSADGHWESGNWAIKADEAKQLVGGMIYLHKTKAKPSYFGGRIEGVRALVTTGNGPTLFVLRFKHLQEAREVRWKGVNYGRAWTSGVVAD